MNFDAHRAVWEAWRAGRLPTDSFAALVVGLAMADRTNRAGETWQSQSTLAEDLHTSRATVSRAQAALVAGGVYKVTDPGRGHRATRHALAVHGWTSGPGDNVATDDHGRSAIAVHAEGLAVHLDDLADHGRSSHIEPIYIPTGSRADEVTTPAELPDRVADLRGRLNGRRP